MKKTLFPLVVMVMLLLWAVPAPAQDYNGALKEAQREQKPLLLYFFSKSCAYCVEMERTTLADKGVNAMLKKDFVVLRVDADKSTDLTRLYRISGTPSSWFLDASGKRLFELPGYIRAKDYKKILEYVKGKYYAKMDLQDFLDKGPTGK
jgi:thioredoxin-related protein